MRHWKTRKTKTRPKVAVIVATYKQEACLRALVGSLQAQTYDNFECHLVHDGPYPHDHGTLCFFDSLTGYFPDNRFHTHETDKRENCFGHNCRQYGLDEASSDVELVCFTNGDNLYAPVFLEALVHALETQSASLAYCNLVHSHARDGKCWQPMSTHLHRGHIDIGACLLKRSLLNGMTWGKDFAADWEYLSRLLKTKPKTVKVDEYLFYHQ